MLLPASSRHVQCLQLLAAIGSLHSTCQKLLHLEICKQIEVQATSPSLQTAAFAGAGS